MNLKHVGSVDKRNFLQTMKVELLQKLKNAYPSALKIVLLGSSARDTNLYKKLELDYFIYFKQFEAHSFNSKIVSLFPDAEVQYKSRGFPYVRLTLWSTYKLYVDVVPVINSPDLKCNTERANEYVLKHMSQVERREVLRSKKVLKHIGLYDADSNTKGFSGYCTQILVLKYGSLKRVPDDLTYLQDPVVPGRNLLGSVSPENLIRFNVLKNNNFKKKANIENMEHVYRIQNAPLKLLYTLRNEACVTAAVYVSKSIYVELKDHYVSMCNLKTGLPFIDYKSPGWIEKNHQSLYLSGKPFKKICKLSVIDKYKNYDFKKCNKKQLRTYSYFK